MATPHAGAALAGLCEPLLGDDELAELGARIEHVHADADALGALVEVG